LTGSEFVVDGAVTGRTAAARAIIVPAITTSA
jgi:hypothetical protein